MQQKEFVWSYFKSASSQLITKCIISEKLYQTLEFFPYIVTFILMKILTCRKGQMNYLTLFLTCEDTSQNKQLKHGKNWGFSCQIQCFKFLSLLEQLSISIVPLSKLSIH